MQHRSRSAIVDAECPKVIADGEADGHQVQSMHEVSDTQAATTR